MEKLSVHQRKIKTKQGKPRKKPIKVVYISNPMKVKTSASEFRAIVQELTGRDSGLADAAKFKEIDAVDGPKILPDQVMKVTDDHVLEVPRMDPNRFSPGSSDSLFEPFDDVITPQMLENFAGFLRSNLVYESSQLM